MKLNVFIKELYEHKAMSRPLTNYIRLMTYYKAGPI